MHTQNHSRSTKTAMSSAANPSRMKSWPYRLDSPSDESDEYRHPGGRDQPIFVTCFVVYGPWTGRYAIPRRVVSILVEVSMKRFLVLLLAMGILAVADRGRSAGLRSGTLLFKVDHPSVHTVQAVGAVPVAFFSK